MILNKDFIFKANQPLPEVDTKTFENYIDIKVDKPKKSDSKFKMTIKIDTAKIEKGLMEWVKALNSLAENRLSGKDFKKLVRL